MSEVCTADCTDDGWEHLLTGHEPTDFWNLFTYVAATNTDVLQHIIFYMPAGGAACLRGVNRAWRSAVNRTVQGVVCRISTLPADVELAAVFPEAHSLRLQLQSGEGTSAVQPEAAPLVFQQITSSSPELVKRVQSLQLCMQFVTNVERTAGAVADFLARCACDQEQGPMHTGQHTRIKKARSIG
jgi:hypothetical protein